MIPDEPLLVILVRLVEHIPAPPPPQRKRGHPRVYYDRTKRLLCSCDHCQPKCATFWATATTMILTYASCANSMIAVWSPPSMITIHTLTRVHLPETCSTSCAYALSKTSANNSMASLTSMTKCLPKDWPAPSVSHSERSSFAKLSCSIASSMASSYVLASKPSSKPPDGSRPTPG